MIMKSKVGMLIMFRICLSSFLSYLLFHYDSLIHNQIPRACLAYSFSQELAPSSVWSLAPLVKLVN